MNKVRVLVVDDSAFMRKLISDFLQEDEQIEVIGIARNGKDALAKVELLNPDVITLDVEMPLMNGLEALKTIMERFPRPVIMLSSTTKEGTENTIKSLQYGAFDFISKPSGAISLDLYKIKEQLISIVKTAVKANLKNIHVKNTKIYPQQKVRYSKIDTYREESTISSVKSKLNKTIVCIGTSTGGPRALQHVLPKLPAEIEAPILIVQHMPPGFTHSLANRLNTLCAITVKEAEEGEIVQNGTAYIAPGGSHLKVLKSSNSLVIKIDKSEIRNGHRPSVDVMFESLSMIQDYRKVAVIMTGMGTDGTEGLKRLKSTGEVSAISESEQTAVVYGMPKSAVGTNLVDKVEVVDEIATSIMKYIRN
ncbi:protein-glutamate methylesterase/protein-glutamine glutaminase [Metabacillus malikii]|uniref:Protein-glutamate methylesterase/protein-glutamine glutaminase n=1 Tax=Metabacillus malikii TaxID=1504265 RepID=A0ABT9ZE22_9BACI|nr:chemotaxis response regulator protein-glutamate methylesterase [Metabacillus malikii]MDQ0230514.1 two-component system chemotaxis response regulator CheB [Metabacillus malikii]